MLTQRQKQIYEFIKQYIRKKDYAPSLEEIKKHFKLKSVGTIHEHIETLQTKGFLEKTDNQARAINIFEKEPMAQIDVLGNIAAGQPIEAIAYRQETIAVPKINLPKSGEFFGLRVSGDSMIDENINDGDIVIIKKQHSADSGDEVVALINNHEATLKKIYKEKGKIKLQPANPKIEPIYIDPNNLIIQGIVIDIIKNITEKKEIKKEASVKKHKKIPLNKIICGDAIKELKKLPDESCDVIICDPPYNIGKDFGNNLDKRELNEYVSWCKEWINESIRAMKPAGTMFIYGFSEILAYLSVEIPINKRWLIWHYTNKNVASLNFWQRSHEAIICAWKDKSIFNRDDVREPYTEGFLNGAAGKVRKGTAGRFSSNGKETIYNAHKGGALPRDVIKIPALAGGAGMNERWFICKTCKGKVFEPRELKKHADHEIVKHPTQKPLELSKKLIISAMPKKGGVVLVPFVGTGSECAAAKILGQSYVGFEINPDYIKLAEKYLEKTRYIPKLF